MDMGQIVNWIQLVIWIYGGIALTARMFRNPKETPPWIRALFQSNLALSIVIISGICTSAWTLYWYNREGIYRYDEKAKLELIENRTFHNEDVVLDGKEFRECGFVNVTFRYNGTAPYKVIHSTIAGSHGLASNNGAVETAWGTLKGLGAAPDVILYNKEGHRSPNVMEPMRVTPEQCNPNIQICPEMK